MKYLPLLLPALLLLSCGTESTPIYNLTTSITGEGTVSPSSGEFEEGETVTLTAAPSEHWVFNSWSGDGSGTSNSLTITMNGDKNVVGNFKSRSEQFEDYSEINKTTSWYSTNLSFKKLFENPYLGFEEKENGTLIPFKSGSTFNPTANYFWAIRGEYIYSDLTGDGMNDLWAFYYKGPWPTNQQGLHLFSPYEANPDTYNLQVGLTQVRKVVLADLSGNGNNELILFSHGYDANPFPGDSLGIFYPLDLRYDYLSQAIGFFHGGAAGDVTNDGLVDILAYSGGGQNPVRPIFYRNLGGDNFQLDNSIFRNFTDQDNFYTVELFDLNKSGQLDLVLATKGKLIIIPNIDGIFDRSKATEVNISPQLEPMDIAFFDMNKNGFKDLIILSNVSYTSYILNVFTNDGNNFKDKTNEFIDINQGNEGWISRIRIFDFNNNGEFDLVPDGYFPNINDQNFPRFYWENVNGYYEKKYTNI